MTTKCGNIQSGNFTPYPTSDPCRDFQSPCPNFQVPCSNFSNEIFCILLKYNSSGVRRERRNGYNLIHNILKINLPTSEPKFLNTVYDFDNKSVSNFQHNRTCTITNDHNAIKT